MERINLTVEFYWEQIGEVGFDEEEALVFPKTPPKPGLYRFYLEYPEGPAAYIGESDQLARRLQHYRTPGPSQTTNIRLNGMIRATLLKRHRVQVATVTDNISIRLGVEEGRVNLTRKLDRVLLEHAAIFKAYTAGLKIVNA